MTFERLIVNPHGEWAAIACSTDFVDMRRQVANLSATLAAETRSSLVAHPSGAGQILLVPILRGGALLYHEFALCMPEADVCLLAMRRSATAVECVYSSGVTSDAYDAVVYIDCVAGTANTLFAARREIARRCVSALDVAAVLCASRVATERLIGSRFAVVGFALAEDLDGPLVLPDLGAADAGDLFSSPRLRVAQ